MCVKAFLVLAVLFSSVSGWGREVEFIPSRLYFQTVQREIANAKTSISVYMYFFSVQPNQPRSEGFQLAQSLRKAHERGVKVEVVLDKNYEFAGEEGAGGEGKNLAAFAFLKGLGIPVYFDDAGTYTHAKALIIDGETLITGSSNWTHAALSVNQESNVLVRSKEVARDILRELGTVKREAPPVPGPFVSVPVRVLGGKMASQPDERAFDAYLYLLWKGGGDIALDYGDLAEHLGIGDMERNAYRRQINKTLVKLRDRYGLISASMEYGKDSRVSVPPFKTADTVSVPVDFWRWGWNRRLSFAGKVFYLVSLRESAASPLQPRWSQHLRTLARRYGTSLWFMSRGVTELRRANLVEVEYGPLSADGSGGRGPNVYTPNPLYDPGELDRALEKLGRQHGAEKVDRARQLAALVYEDNYLHGIELLIELEGHFGPEKLIRAAGILGAKRPDNPKRNIGYLIATVRNLD